MYEVFVPMILMIVGAWIMVQGSIFNSSAELEGKITPVWGIGLYAIGGFTIVINLFFTIITLFGGELEMIPAGAWNVFTASITMIGAVFASSMCIMVAAKMGAKMLMEKPELSIWSLLFVALGEGIAIYGLIVAILLSG